MRKHFIFYLFLLFLAATACENRNLDQAFLAELDAEINDLDSIPTAELKQPFIDQLVKNLEPYRTTDSAVVARLPMEMDKIFNNIIRDYGIAYQAMVQLKADYSDGKVELEKAQNQFKNMRKMFHRHKKSFYSMQGVASRDPRILIQQGAETIGVPASKEARSLSMEEANKAAMNKSAK